LPLLLLLLLLFRHAVRVSLELLQLLQENGSLFFEVRFPYVCPDPVFFGKQSIFLPYPSD
jgi:hypothetical protein